MTDILHMFAMLSDANMKYALYPFPHLALLNDTGNLALWMSVKSHESAQCSTASHLLYYVLA